MTLILISDIQLDSETLELINSQMNDIIETNIPPNSQIDPKTKQYIADLEKHTELLCKDIQKTQTALTANQKELDRISTKFYEQFSPKFEVSIYKYIPNPHR